MDSTTLARPPTSDVDRDAVRRVVLTAIESIAPEADVRRIRAGQPLRQQIDLDSVDWLNLIVSLHEKLGIDIPDADYGKLSSVDSIVDYASSRPRGTAPAPRAREQPGAALPPAHFTIGETQVTLRPICPEDAALEAAFVHELTTEDRYKRFMVTVADLPPAKLEYLTNVDQVRHVALAATVDREGVPVLVGAVRYVVDATGRDCEFAIAVEEDWQRTGLAGILMQRLIEIARSRGLATMYGLVLATNHKMLKFCRQLGFKCRHEPEDYSTVRVTLAL